MSGKLLMGTAMLFIAGQTFALNTDIKGFFATKSGAEKKLPANEIYPRGRLFPFSFYSIGGGTVKRRNDLLPEKERIADQKQIISCGVTMIGPQYELNEQIIADAKKFKVKAVYTVEGEVDGQKITHKFFDELNKKKGKLDMAKARKSIAAIVKKVGGDPTVAWWNFTPEETRYWYKQEFAYLKMACETIRKFDPLKRPIFMYDPGHVNGKRMAKTGKYLDVIGKGMYTNYSRMKDQRVYCRWSIEQELDAIKRIGKAGKVPIAVPEMFKQPKPGEIKKIESWVRHDVYCAMVAGAKGVLVFSASKRPKFAARMAYLKVYMQVCRELQGELGQVFLFGKRKKDLTLSVIDGPETINFKYHKFKAVYPSVSMANIAWKNSRYVVLVNSSDKQVEAMLDGLVYGSGVTVQNLFDKKDNFTAPEGQVELEFKPLEVKAFRIYHNTEK
jgi:hypothetical protein